MVRGVAASICSILVRMSGTIFSRAMMLSSHNLCLALEYSHSLRFAQSFHFAFKEATNFRARDKELSNYSNTSIGLGLTYELKSEYLSWFNKSTVNLYWDHMQFDYDDFRDVTAGGDVGTEALYSVDADVIRFYFSFWY